MLIVVEGKQAQTALSNLNTHRKPYAGPDHNIARPVYAQLDPAQAHRQRKPVQHWGPVGVFV